MSPEPGTLIAGRYRLERKLGAGGMGVVWSATQELTRQPVALKFLKEEGEDTHARKRFLREARAACAVKHPNVVQVHDVLLLDDGTPVIVMELLEGESLATRIKREKRLSVEDTARIMLQVVAAVGTAHAHGVVHRDLKPDNIFLAKDASGEVHVKVVDFGIAKLTSAIDGDAEKTNGLTTTGTMLGTPYYMSPEQAFGEKDIDHRSDIWSLGIIFHRCLTGSLPTFAENVGQVLKIILSDKIPPLSEKAPEVPDEIVQLVKRMLTRDRDERPKDLREVQNVLRRYSSVPAASFGAPIAPPQSSGRLPDLGPPSTREVAAAPTVRDTPAAARRAASAEPVEERATTSIGSLGFDVAPEVKRSRGRTLAVVLGVAAGVSLVGGWAAYRSHDAIPATSAAELLPPSPTAIAAPEDLVTEPPAVVAPAPAPTPAQAAEEPPPAAAPVKARASSPPAKKAPTTAAVTTATPASTSTTSTAAAAKPNVFVEQPPF